MPIFKSKKVWIPVAILLVLIVLALGFIVGLLVSHGVKLEESFTYDGLASLVVGLVTIAAATVILPIMIQPLFQKQQAVNGVTQANIEVILKHLSLVIDLVKDLKDTQRTVTDNDRKLILSYHSRIANYVKIINNHSDTLSALSSFNDDIAQPLSDARTNFAELVVPDMTINEGVFLQIKQAHEAVEYRLVELQYDIN